MADFFWFSDTQWARIEQLLPTDARGKPRVDDRRVLSGCPSVSGSVLPQRLHDDRRTWHTSPIRTSAVVPAERWWRMDPVPVNPSKRVVAVQA
ncbi:hypothetical protein EWE75_23735 [Sphingomonas populi]|uniref:Transposase n=1 Tax=Sphingomonas populi TaxID=2484750 RepID=A0A4Q6XQW7_9SPHN|nr:hypothetical protein EWE75_23735 [Sphingomonas populi]